MAPRRPREEHEEILAYSDRETERAVLAVLAFLASIALAGLLAVAGAALPW